MNRSMTLVAWVGILTTYACTNEAKPTYPQRRGGRGEACLVLNDCKEPLLCSRGRCLDPEVELEATGKQCVVAQCVEDGDCCQPISTARQASCDAQVEQCQGNQACEARARSRCTCSAVCDAYRCVFQGEDSGCLRDEDCPGARCSAGTCIECSFDGDCGAGLVCESGVCSRGCTHDEQCGRLSRCEDARCVVRGCVSQRECIGLLGMRDAECRNEECVVPCESDSACATLGPLNVCTKKVCRSLGCEENVDCSHQDLGGGSLVLCLDMAEAERLRSSTGADDSFRRVGVAP